jgi:methylenetetrahydrofolate dehydrogenase (NADP+)/methenyltetrahydrofolate cyclohydrolase
VRAQIASDVRDFQEAHGRAPQLTTIIVGDDEASKVYVAGKHRACEQVGITSRHHGLDAATSQAELLATIQAEADDDAVDGILVQLPLPGHLDELEVLEAVPPEKDVDGFHPYNVGRMAAGLSGLPQCTPFGVVRLLDEYDIPIEGANACIIGRSNLVGKPLSRMLLARNATVTVCHSRTRDLAEHTRMADIVVAAVGKVDIVTGPMVKPGAAVIDVGVNRTDHGLVGDVDFASVSEVAGFLTPVPGGVGPMTITMLLQNTLDAARDRERRRVTA